MTVTQDIFLERLQEVDAYEFERLVAKLWEQQGWDTLVTSGADDGGVDVIAEKSRPFPRKQVIQVKRYEPSNSVGRPDIQQYASIRQERTDVDTVAVVTTGQFTDGAEEVGKRLNVKLIDGSQLYNLIDALDAFQLAQSYIGPEVDQEETPAVNTETGTTGSSSEQVDRGEGSQAITEFDEDTDLEDVPTLLPSLIKLRGEVLSDLQTIQSTLDSAEEAFDEQRYFDAVERYEEVNRQQIELNREIARYDAGLTRIDSTTADHLPSAEEFTGQLAQITEGADEHFREAFRITEKAKGLELLVKEIHDHVNTIQNRIERGDQMRQNGEIERAHTKYEQAKRGLEQTRQTMQVYEGLIAEFDDKIIDAHHELSQEISLSELETEITSRINSKEEHLDVPKIAEEAAGSFSASILTGNEGELFDKELIEYLDEDEQLEFAFEPPRMGVRVIPSDGTEETPYHDALESGASFLLVTDQRILYVAGVDDHDETWCFKFHQISDVEASTDATSPSLEFTHTDGEKYVFTGMRGHISDLEAAARFIKAQFE